MGAARGLSRNAHARQFRSHDGIACTTGTVSSPAAAPRRALNTYAGRFRAVAR